MNREHTTAGRGKSYASFLIRFWMIRKRGDEEELTVEVQSVQSGEKSQFDNLEAALAFLRDQAKGMLLLACM